MSEVSKKVDSIQAKLGKLSRRLEKLTAENERLLRSQSELERKLDLGNRKIESMQADHNRVKLAKTLVSNSSDKAEMKFRVNELVREIDKCIALLNR